MQGLIMDYPLTLTHILERARRLFPRAGDDMLDRPVALVTGGGQALHGAVEAKLPANLQRDVLVDRAGVGFLLGHAEPREEVEYRMRLNFELARQLIDSDFLHRKRTT